MAAIEGTVAEGIASQSQLSAKERALSTVRRRHVCIKGLQGVVFGKRLRCNVGGRKRSGGRLVVYIYIYIYIYIIVCIFMCRGSFLLL